MGATLKVRPADKNPFEVAISSTTTIGRSRINVISLDFSPQVSRQHAVIRRLDETQYQIMDLGSRNGTFVNGRQVIMPMTLNHGDLIRITDNELIFEQVEAPAAVPAQEDRTLATSTGIAYDYSATVAVMVCDIRGFSTMSEILPQKNLAHTLGEWFRIAGDLVHETGGTIDKFIGDAILAYWIRDPKRGHESQNALDVGFRLLEKASQRHWPGHAEKPFSIAVAIHHGPVTCRNVGLVAQRDATIIGDAVNTVFRIESVMKTLGQKLAVSEDLISSLDSHPPGLNRLGSHQLKGKNKPVHLFGTDA